MYTYIYIYTIFKHLRPHMYIYIYIYYIRMYIYSYRSVSQHAQTYANIDTQGGWGGGGRRAQQIAPAGPEKAPRNSNGGLELRACCGQCCGQAFLDGPAFWKKCSRRSHMLPPYKTRHLSAMHHPDTKIPPNTLVFNYPAFSLPSRLAHFSMSLFLFSLSLSLSLSVHIYIYIYQLLSALYPSCTSTFPFSFNVSRFDPISPNT